jgi:TolB-like protein
VSKNRRIVAGLLLLACLCGCARQQSAQNHANAAVRASAGPRAITYPAPLILSVLAFEDRTRTPELAWLRNGLADLLVAELAKNPSLVVVQRQRLEEVFREQAFQLSGRVADESTVRIGKLAGATVLVTGSVALADRTLRVDAQLVGVEQGIVLGTASSEGPVDDVHAVVAMLIEKIRELLPPSAATAGGPAIQQGADADMLLGAQANVAGEQLARRGKLFEALEEFERAMAKSPHNPVVRGNYSKAVQELSGAELIKSAAGDTPPGSERIVGRMVERLTNGFDSTVGRAKTEAAEDGTMTLRVPVRLGLSSASVQAVLQSVRSVGGTVRGGSGADGDADIAAVLKPDLHRELMRQLAVPRRLYLRLLSRDGRAIGIYSDYRGWLLSNWIAVEGEEVRVRRQKAVESEAVFERLPSDQMVSLASVKVTVDPVPQERASVRVEMQEFEASSGNASADRRRIPVEPYDDAETAALQHMVAEAWFPPVTERPWSPGHLPSNERTAVVTLVEKEGRILEEPRLLRSSGEPGFDRAALTSVQATFARWFLQRGAGPAGWKGTTQEIPPKAVKVRIQFQLRQDVPSLNLIGPKEVFSPLSIQ